MQSRLESSTSKPNTEIPTPLHLLKLAGKDVVSFLKIWPVQTF